MRLTKRTHQRIAKLLSAPPSGFVELVERVGLAKDQAFRFADLSGIDLRGQRLAGFDLTGARLTDVDFADADLSGAILAGADLTNADLSRARGIDRQRNFVGARIDGARWPEQGEPPSDFNIAQAHAMILAGKAVPNAWVPFIEAMNFQGSRLQNLEPLSKSLTLNSCGTTEASDQQHG